MTKLLALTPALVLSCLASNAAAQIPPTPPPADETYMVLVTPREVSAIDEDIASTDVDLADAITAESAAVARRDNARAAVDAKKLQIDDVKRQRKDAKDANNEAGAAALDASRKALERERDLLEERQALRNAEIDLARQKRELASLTRRMLTFEKELALKRIENDGSTATGPERSSLRRVTLDLEAQTLNARVAQADKAVDVASREKRVTQRLLKILEAQQRLVLN